MSAIKCLSCLALIKWEFPRSSLVKRFPSLGTAYTFSRACILRILINLVPRAHMPLGQHQDTELWNNHQDQDFRTSCFTVHACLALASRDKVDVDVFQKGIQYALEKLAKLKFGFERTAVSNFKSKRHECSGNETVDYFRSELRALVLTKRHVGSGNEIEFYSPYYYEAGAASKESEYFKKVKLLSVWVHVRFIIWRCACYICLNFTA